MAEELKDQDIQNPETKEKDTPTVEELLAQLAQERAEKEKLKNANNKLSSENAETKKQLRAKQTAEEQEDEAKKEAEAQRNEYIKSLEAFKKKAEVKDRYITIQGMDAVTAEKAAVAEVEGDMDTLSAIQKAFQEARLKDAQKEWYASRPDIYAGAGTVQVTKEEFDKMDITERTALKRKDPNLYRQLLGK